MNKMADISGERKICANRKDYDVDALEVWFATSPNRDPWLVIAFAGYGVCVDW